MKKKHYLIYQITNNINGKIYIGKHETFKIDDNYFGSGIKIQAAIKKYGLENFTKTILFDLQNEDEMNLLEMMVVTWDFCKRKDVYNLTIGGKGTWKHVNSNKKLNGGNFTDHKKYAYKLSIALKKFWNSLDINKKRKRCEKATKIFYDNRYDWKNKHHTAETKQKMSNTAKLRLYNHPELNSRFNTVWITNDLCQISISVKKSIAQQIINDNNNWRYGRCTNFQKLKQQNNFAIMKKVNDKIHLERQNSLYCAFYTFYYQKYLEFGYSQFQAKYQFNVERTALLHLFRKYAPNYQKFKRFHNKVHASSSNL